MKGRFVAAAVTAAVLMACCSGCFLRAEKVTQKTAHITVDHVTRTSHAVACSQVEWLLTAVISAAPATVKVALKLDAEKPKVESVNIDDYNNFTGVADSGAGNATAVFAGNTYTITGEAQGSKRNDPRVSMTAPFKIEVGC
ncbi:MAG: lipoprotein LpqH [Mycobacterium sp.]